MQVHNEIERIPCWRGQNHKHSKAPFQGVGSQGSSEGFGGSPHFGVREDSLAADLSDDARGTDDHTSDVAVCGDGDEETKSMRGVLVSKDGFEKLRGREDGRLFESRFRHCGWKGLDETNGKIG